MRILDGACRKWRANFHTHTTESDGSKTPEEAMALYRGMGYDILSLTDHRMVTRPEHVPEGLLLIPGIEMDFFHQAWMRPLKRNTACAKRPGRPSRR